LALIENIIYNLKRGKTGNWTNPVNPRKTEKQKNRKIEK